MPSRLLAALPLAALLLASCGLDELTLEDRRERELHRNRIRWAQADLHDYTFRLSVDCDCEPALRRDVIVVVRGDVPVSVTHADDGTAAPAGTFDRFDTVEDLFRRVQEAVDANAASIAVLYEGEAGVSSAYALGYPESAILDYSEFRHGEELEWVILYLDPDD